MLGSIIAKMGPTDAAEVNLSALSMSIRMLYIMLELEVRRMFSYYLQITDAAMMTTEEAVRLIQVNNIAALQSICFTACNIHDGIFMV